MKEKPTTLRFAVATRPHLEGHVRITVVAECVAEKACVLGGTSWARVGPFCALAAIGSCKRFRMTDAEGVHMGPVRAPATLPLRCHRSEVTSAV